MLSLDARRFRSNPRFDAVPVNALLPGQRISIEAIAGSNVWAVLRSRETGHFSLGIDHPTAVIFHSLAEPLTGSTILAGLPSRHRYRVMKRLVCDQVLQIECLDGSFADGVLAHDDLFPQADSSDAALALKDLDRLSKAALDYAVALHSPSSAALARRLYSFNATPRTQRWDTLLPDADATARWLGLTSPAAWRESLNRRYIQHAPNPGETPWLQWIRKGVDPRSPTRAKIYVSPASARIAEALPIVADVCCTMGVSAFKVGTTLLGILRPDKLVVYVRDEQELQQVAGELHSAVASFEPHGVPFTAPIDGAGLLSWAIDPMEEPMLRSVEQPCSWRMAVAGRLADSIARATGHGCEARVVDFTLQRLRLDGVEPVGWRPGKDGELV